jgi:hypothetical protein
LRSPEVVDLGVDPRCLPAAVDRGDGSSIASGFGECYRGYGEVAFGGLGLVVTPFAAVALTAPVDRRLTLAGPFEQSASWPWAASSAARRELSVPRSVNVLSGSRLHPTNR